MTSPDHQSITQRQIQQPLVPALMQFTKVTKVIHCHHSNRTVLVIFGEEESYLMVVI